MRPMIRYLLPLVLVALAGCEKNEIPEQFGLDGLIEARLTFSVTGFDETKSLATDIADDEVDVIDIFSWDDNNAIVGHTTIGTYGGSALDLDNVSYTDYGGQGQKRYYLILANLDPDTSDYIATLS